MTSEDFSAPSADSTPSRPRRRRVVRDAAAPAPTSGAPASQLGSIVVGDVAVPVVAEGAGSAAAEPRTSAPKKASTRTRKAAAPVAAVAQQDGDGAASAAVSRASAADAEPPVRKRASRRVTKAAAPASSSGDLPLVASTSTATDAAPPTSEPTVATGDEPAAPRRATRSRARKTAEPAVEAAAPALEDASVDTPAKAPRRATRTRRPAAAVEPEVAEGLAAEPDVDVAPTAARSGRSAGTKKTAASKKSAASTAPSSKAESSKADVKGAADADEQPSTSPRLATTALLFQAPDPGAARSRRRRAVAPTGTPQFISEAVQEEPAAAPVAEDVAEDDALETALDTDALDAAPLDEDVADDEDATEDADGSDEDSDDDEDSASRGRRRRRRGGRGRRRSGSDRASSEDDSDEDGDADAGAAAPGADVTGPDTGTDTDAATGSEDDSDDDSAEDGEASSSRRRRRRRRGSRGEGEDEQTAPAASSRRQRSSGSDEVTALRGSTRLEAKRQRRREGRDAGRRRQIITEAEFLARREAVDRAMVVREKNGRTQIAVLEDGILVEHYVTRESQLSMAGNVYLGRVQNVLPSMEAAFVDVGKGRNAVLYAGEVNWDAAGLDGQPRRIEQALKSGDSVLVQVTKDPIGHKGARLTSQITLAGRYLVYVPGGGMTGISRKLPEKERARLKKLLREIVPETAGVIVRTAAEGASEEELRADIARLQGQWEKIEKKAKTASAPALLQGEPDLAIRVVRDVFNDDFGSLVVSGSEAWDTISSYVGEMAPDLAERVSRWTGQKDVFAEHRIDEQLAKGMDRKVWLPSGGSLVIDRTEAMTVVDVNTGKFTGSGGTLEETVTRNNLEAAEEIVRQLRLRDIGGIIVIDFIDMVLESNRDLVLRRLVECLGRDRTKHQVAEVTSLGLVQMTRKRVGQGLVEAFSETCDHCHGRGFIVHDEPIERGGSDHSHSHGDSGQQAQAQGEGDGRRSRRKRGGGSGASAPAASTAPVPVLPEARDAVNATLATIAAAAAHAHELEEQAKQGAKQGTTTQAESEVVAAGSEAPSATFRDEPVVAAQPAPAPAAEPEPATEPEPAAGAGRPRRRRAAGRAAGPAVTPAAEVVAVADAPVGPADVPVIESVVVVDDGGTAEQLDLTPVDPAVFDLPDGGDEDERSDASGPQSTSQPDEDGEA